METRRPDRFVGLGVGGVIICADVSSVSGRRDSVSGDRRLCNSGLRTGLDLVLDLGLSLGLRADSCSVANRVCLRNERGVCPS
jgi:hypothetical protein